MQGPLTQRKLKENGASYQYEWDLLRHERARRAVAVPRKADGRGTHDGGQCRCSRQPPDAWVPWYGRDSDGRESGGRESDGRESHGRESHGREPGGGPFGV